MSKRSRRAALTPASASPAGASVAARRAAAVPSVGDLVLGQPLFVTSISLSAFLLFTLELLAGRLVLPTFGGSPAVWTTALCFFTGVVFVGYLYAHASVTRLGQRRGGLVHLGLAMAVVAATILAPTDIGALRDERLPEAVNVLLVLALVAGPTAFLLATTSPLLQAWFAGRGGTPWWLYAASNAASLAGLLAYPFLIEPWIPLSSQRVLVAVGLVLFVVTLVAVVAGGRRVPPIADRPRLSEAPRLARRRQVVWVLAAIIPAGLLSATTTYLSTDLVSAPLLWVGPLAIYLGSFVVAFSERGRRSLPVMERLVPAAVTLMWIPYVLVNTWPVVVLVPFMLLAYAVIAIAVHGRLALDRPDEAHLTRFYVLTSLGGLLATAFVALVAPLVFNAVYEYPILLVGGLAVMAVLPGPGQAVPLGGVRGVVVEAGRRLAPYVALAIVLVTAAAVYDASSALTVALIFTIGALVIALGATRWLLAAGTAGVIVVMLILAYTNPLVRERTFFGVIEIRPMDEGIARAEYSGTTLHGVQFIDARQFEPTTYYVRSGPLGDVFDDLDKRLPDGASIGVVGLGAGTVAAYQRPGDAMTFFEIDQAVVDLARNPRYFTYLSSAPTEPRIVLGDARLSLRHEPDASYDVLVLDAFSSDTVPVHLLTREAMKDYLRVLRPGGVIAFHLSNRYYELLPAVSSTARSLGMAAVGLSYVPGPTNTDQIAARSSSWVVAGKVDDVFRFAKRGWTEPFDGPVLTDDFSDILRLLRFP